MAFFQSEPKKENTEKSKIDYNRVKKCVLKKEAGEPSEECKDIFKKIGVEE